MNRTNFQKGGIDEVTSVATKEEDGCRRSPTSWVLAGERERSDRPRIKVTAGGAARRRASRRWMRSELLSRCDGVDVDLLLVSALVICRGCYRGEDLDHEEGYCGRGCIRWMEKDDVALGAYAEKRRGEKDGIILVFDVVVRI